MGGMERASVNFANSLNDFGLLITYISIFNQSKFFKLNDGIVFIEPLNFNKNKLSLFKTIFWLRKEINKTGINNIFVFNKFYGAIVLLSTCNLKLKVFISERSSPNFQWSFGLNIFNRIIYSFIKPVGVIAQTGVAAQYQKNYYGKNVPIKIIPNVLRDVAMYKQINRENIILAIGRLNDYLKGFDRLISAFSLIKNQDDWRLCFIGGDGDKSGLKEQVVKLGIEDQVFFLGQIKEIDEWYAKASIFVIPSRSEGFPNALAEAMAAGLPCIAFDFIAGPRDMITHEFNGIIVEDGNIEAMANAIIDLMENENKRKFLGYNALIIRDALSKEKLIPELIEFISIK